MRAVIQREFGGPQVLVDEYSLERAADAHAAIEQRRQRGKVVLIP